MLQPLEAVAAKTRVMEDAFIAAAGNDVTPAFGDYLRPLLGDGGDPAFAEHLKLMARGVVLDRALDGLVLRAIGPFFDYYLTYAISAEVGVLVRWLDGGMRESVRDMARIMTALMFVRPGDLYDNPIDLDIPNFVLDVMFPEEDGND